MDYANSVLCRMQECAIKRLQLLQNRAENLLLKWKSTDCSIEAIKHLNCLPVYYRIRFKIACVVFECLNDSESQEYVRECYVNKHHHIFSALLIASLNTKCLRQHKNLCLQVVSSNWTYRMECQQTLELSLILIFFSASYTYFMIHVLLNNCVY